MLFWAFVFLAVAVCLYAIILFNSLVRTRQMANEAWSGIDVQLKRRSELVPTDDARNCIHGASTCSSG